MSKRNQHPQVDAFLREATQWRKEFAALRALVLACGLTEALKWGKPCYTLAGANVVLIHGFKEYCALLFFKGALLKDAPGLLIQQTEHVQAGRQIRFTQLREITAQKAVLQAYIKEAIAVEQAGLKVPLKKTSEFAMPEELKHKLATTPALRRAFSALTPGRQRGYLLYFAGAKQSATRAARVEKCAPQILAGKGLND